ncbi:ATP-grasp domain-containing protein [Streptomyces iconiensis]|uniref:ATP-grasp domain-containing protein n=1 Tax=Streptomyces iconiensis TaxID=1384038 RepID=A0ABT7A6P1_9ACTN|nr:ATP-grasp domain-containing protein [Streptomyces iconiensis]MDJ1137002.1 ATP-grasp domain-containing protein [Streptomyces iconiensis]
MPTMIVLGYRPDLDEALRRRNLDPYYLVQPPTASVVGRRFTRVTDIENVQEISRAVLAADIEDAVGVLSVHEMGVFGATCLRQQLNLPGNRDSKTALYFRDKYLQKSKVPSHIKRARCRYIARDTSFTGLAEELGDTFVVKPATGAGSLRTNIVRSPEDYARALEQLPDHSDVEIVAESFVAAPEVYVDGIWRKGALQWSSMTRYHVSPLAAAHGGILAAHILDRRRHATLFRQAETLTEQVLTRLGAPDCVFHLEVFAGDGGLTFGECAIRLPGALSPQTNKLTFGVDLFDVEISLALGEEPERTPDSGAPERLYGYILLRPSGSGELTQKDFESNFLFDQLTYTPDKPPGPYGSVGHAIVSDQDELELRKTIEAIARFNEAG